MNDYRVGKLSFVYRCSVGHPTYAVVPLPDEARCPHTKHGKVCDADLYQETPKPKESA